MASRVYDWPQVQRFRDRAAPLAALERWWHGDDPSVVSLYGRRRVGKSWLFRRLAHGKPAIILVADRLSTTQQLGRIAEQLGSVSGVKPALPDVPSLFRTLYRMAAQEKVLVVVDELPYLLGVTRTEQQATLSGIQAVMEEERDASRAKVLLAGSTIATMEHLTDERSPMHGRLLPLRLPPMRFAEAVQLIAVEDPRDQLVRFAVAGGMPRYLAALGAGDLASCLEHEVIGPYAPLYNEPRALVQAELRSPALYFSVLSALAARPQSLNDIATQTGVPGRELSAYLATLQSLQLVGRRLPVGAARGARTTQWGCDDDFIRFWFRFVQPYQAELEAGADPGAYVRHQVMPRLADHVSPTFERAVGDWLRLRYAGQATGVGRWWGPALHASRAAGSRTTEEVDAVAVSGRHVLAVAEAKWTTRRLGVEVLHDLTAHKLPAMRQAGLDVEGADIVLASRSGFTEALIDAAAMRPRVRLVSAAELLAEVADVGAAAGGDR